MKNVALFFSLCFLLIQSSCIQDKCTQTSTYTYLKPVYVTPEEYKIPVKLGNSEALKEPGKIYFYYNFILINELRKGIHIINNQDPTSPVNEGFIEIPGNIDMAVMNDILYADAYTDLLVIDLKNIKEPRLIERKENLFESFYFIEGSNRLLSHYETTDITEKFDCSHSQYGNNIIIDDGGVFVDLSGNPGVNNFESSADGNPKTGQGGSMARFTISKNHLFAVGLSELYSLPILSDGNVGESVLTPLPWGIETISSYKNYLFLGANDGMHIVDIANPLSPELKSSFTHARACDPVVVDNDIAYVTLRTGGQVCPGDRNELQVIDVKDIFNPVLLHSYPMTNPHGLGFWDNQLYICEGESGLKIFDKTDISKIDKNLLAHNDDIMAWDVIAVNKNLLLLIGNDGFYQFDCSDPANIILLSSLNIEK
jgi:hypothetical protein